MPGKYVTSDVSNVTNADLEHEALVQADDVVPVKNAQEALIRHLRLKIKDLERKNKKLMEMISGQGVADKAGDTTEPIGVQSFSEQGVSPTGEIARTCQSYASRHASAEELCAGYLAAREIDPSLRLVDHFGK